MRVAIELFGQLSPSLPRKQELDLPCQAAVRDAARALGISPEQIGLITINGVQSELEDILPPDCRLCFFPHVSGG